jgi:hypothetical protein
VKLDYHAIVRRTVSGSYNVNLPAGEARKLEKAYGVDDIVGLEVRVVLVATRP